MDAILNNPVRIYEVAVAVMLLVTHYVQDLPVTLILGLLAAVLGLGETIRAQVDGPITARTKDHIIEALAEGL